MSHSSAATRHFITKKSINGNMVAVDIDVNTNEVTPHEP
jgi:hypothetical protein